MILPRRARGFEARRRLRMASPPAAIPGSSAAPGRRAPSPTAPPARGARRSRSRVLMPGMLGRHIAIDDALADRVAVAAARGDAEKRRATPDRLAAIDGGGLVEEEAAELAARPF